MLGTQEEFLHNTSKWTVVKANGDIVPFDGNKIYNEIIAIAKIAIDYNCNLKIVPDQLARIATIQICASLQSIYRANDCELIEIPAWVIRNTTEFKLAEISFPVAKTYLLEHVMHAINKTRSCDLQGYITK